MEAKTIANYGGPFDDEIPVANPETEQSADYANREMEDCAQMTITAMRASVTFTTTSDAAPATVAAANVAHDTVWGSGVASRPTITKTATGRYTITFAASFTDALSVVENVSFRRGICDAMSSDPIDNCKAQILTIASNVITLKTEAPTGTLADVGDNSGNPFEVTVFLR